MWPINDADKLDADTDVDPVIEAYKKDVDVTLIRENLRLTVDQRFQQPMKLQQFAEDLRLAGRKARETSSELWCIFRCAPFVDHRRWKQSTYSDQQWVSAWCRG
jgi:hypothetical protein